MSVQPSTATDDNTTVARRRSPGLALAVIATAQLMVVLDATIVNVALPSIQDDLGFSVGNLAWVINAYTLAFGALLLLGGRLGDVLGRRRMFVAGLAIFSLASLAGGFAPSEGTLLIARVVQGVGAAIVAANALSLVTTTFKEGPERNRAFGVYAAMSGAGASIGLLLGGLLTETLDWRWVMFVNVPIGIAVAWAALTALPESAREHGRFDILGTAIGSAGVGLGVFGLTRAATDGWSDGVTMSSLIASVVLLVAFVGYESRASHPVMPLWIFRDRNRAGAYLTMLFIVAGMFGMFFFFTQLLQNVLGYGPLKAGAAFLPISVGIVVVSGIAAQLVGRVGIRTFAVTGGLLATASMIWLTRADENASYLTDLLPPMLLLAVGMGLTFVPLTVAATSGVAEREAGLASGVFNTLQQVGGSIGLAVLATVSATATENAISDLVRTSGAAPVIGPDGLPQLPPNLLAQALTDGYSRGFAVSAIFAGLATLAAFLLLRRPPQPEPEADAELALAADAA